MKRAGLVVILMIVVGIAITSAPRDPRKNAPPQVAPTQTQVDRSPQTQEKRKRFIEKLIAMRVFTKLETPGNLARIHTGPRWQFATFHERQKFVSVVSAYAGDEKYWYLVAVYDGRTNRPIGQYSTMRGLQLD